MDKQVMEILSHYDKFYSIEKKMNDIEVKHIQDLSDIKNQVTENKVNITNIENSVDKIEIKIDELFNKIDKHNQLLDTKLDRVEEKIDKNSDKYEKINEELLFRRLLSKLINNNPVFMKTILTLIISSLFTMILYLFALFIK